MFVRHIENGTVIDHIPSGVAHKIARWLHLYDIPYTFVLLANVESKRYGRKDVIKVKDRFFSKQELQKISLLAPNATINTIKNSKILEKYTISPPESVKSILTCPNPKCITNSEDCDTLFHIQKNKLRCRYCERLFSISDFEI